MMKFKQMTEKLRDDLDTVTQRQNFVFQSVLLGNRNLKELTSLPITADPILTDKRPRSTMLMKCRIPQSRYKENKTTPFRLARENCFHLLRQDA